MGGGRARAARAAAAIGAIALLAAGCGESRHPNQQRPQVSTRVSVTVTDGQLIVQPTKVAMGPEKTQQIPQNQNQQQPPVKGDKLPLSVIFVVANQTPHTVALTVSGAGREVESEEIPPRSPGTFGGELPSGGYTITATPGAAYQQAHLAVGTYRASSQNDVLLP